MSMACTELYSEIKPLKDPQPTGPRGQDDEDDAVAKTRAPVSPNPLRSSSHSPGTIGRTVCCAHPGGMS